MKVKTAVDAVERKGFSFILLAHLPSSPTSSSSTTSPTPNLTSPPVAHLHPALPGGVQVSKVFYLFDKTRDHSKQFIDYKL